MNSSELWSNWLMFEKHKHDIKQHTLRKIILGRLLVQPLLRDTIISCILIHSREIERSKEKLPQDYPMRECWLAGASSITMISVFHKQTKAQQPHAHLMFRKTRRVALLFKAASAASREEMRWRRVPASVCSTTLLRSNPPASTRCIISEGQTWRWTERVASWRTGGVRSQGDTEEEAETQEQSHIQHRTL